MKNSRHSFIFCFVFFLFPCITNGQNESFLLVMDMQEIWTKQADNTNNSQNLIDRVNEAITKTNPEKVIYVESLAAELQLSFSGLSLEIKPGLNLDDRLTFVGNTQVMKGRANAFTSEQLQTFINESGASDFTLVGLMAEHCVKETALGGIKKGYSITVVVDAILAESEDSKQSVVEELRNKGVKIISLKDLY